jgi:phospholipase/carboxylesterase
MANARQWWPIATFSAVERAAGAAAAAPELDAFLDAELAAAGLTDDRLLLVGFSQGTMMALQVGLRRERTLAGILCISGILVAPDRLDRKSQADHPCC